MLVENSSIASLNPILLVINRKGECRVIHFFKSNFHESWNQRKTATLQTLFSEENAAKIHTLTREVLTQQSPKPLSISLSSSSKTQPYFSYFFPLSLASVFFIAQPLDCFTGNTQKLALEYLPIPALIYQAHRFAIKAVNQAAIDQYGYCETEFLQMRLPTLHPSHNIPPPLETVSEFVAGEWQHYRKDGKLSDMAVTACPICMGEADDILLTAHDITQYKYTKTVLEPSTHSETALAQRFPPCGILCFDDQWFYPLAVGNPINQLTEMTMAEEEPTIEGRSFSQVFGAELRNTLKLLQEQILLGNHQTRQFQYHHYTFYVHGSPLPNENGNIAGGICIIQNLTPGKQLEALLEKQAFFDPTTHLPNKTWLLQQIGTNIDASDEQGLAVIVVRLERYGVVKYGLGLELAEQLMVAVAQRLKETLQLNDDFARVGDAVIAAILPQIHQKEEIEQIAQLIHLQLSLALEVGEEELFCPVSVGVAIYNPAADQCLQEPSALLHAADTAMNVARGEATLPCVIFHPYLHQPAAMRVHLETELRRALKLKQLHVFYQPTVTIAEGKLSGFEALVRWQHPEQGLVSPSQFMPLAEELGLIGFIDWWVLAEACEKLAIWEKMIPQGHCLSMNVNLSENMINQVGILERLDRIIKGTGIIPSCLKLEVTEGIILEGNTTTASILKQLQKMGILLSIDDFGTGYSSLKRLHQLPINTLKIDRSFTSRMLKDEEIRQIVQTIITLAHNLNMEVIAEGVEEVEQWDFLRSLNCEYGQGFLFSKPLSEEAIRDLIECHQDLILK
ncbi:MAG: hypothetical protein BRC33_03120 [Cyanobacteria bacterium SW_9_44_58]|nr:MAG: hypothetical protein BRC33_03120 [Cyanobacteria bacterium SW_9_44_58]